MRSIPENIVYFINTNNRNYILPVSDDNKPLLSKRRNRFPSWKEESLKNEPLKVKVEGFDWYRRTFICTINDKYRYEDLSPTTLLKCDIENGVIKSPMIWIKDFRKLVLVNTESDVFKDVLVEDSNVKNPITTFIQGNMYLKGRDIFYYVGFHNKKHYILPTYTDDIDTYLTAYYGGENITPSMESRTKLIAHKHIGASGHKNIDLYNFALSNPYKDSWKKDKSISNLEILRILSGK